MRGARGLLLVLVETLISLLVLASLTFVLLRLLPGGPFSEEAALNPLVRAELQKQWGTEQSFVQQWFMYMRALLHGDLGVSMQNSEQTVLDRIVQVARPTFFLNFLALLLVIIVAPFLSYLSLRKNSFNQFIQQFCLMLISLPSLFLAPLLIWIFAVYFKVLPVAFFSSWKHWVLPLLALSLRPIAQWSRVFMRSLHAQKNMDYVRTARAKGLSDSVIIRKHIFSNSMVAALAYLPQLAVGLLSGSFIVEILFAIPGLGSTFVSGLAERDYTLVTGIVLATGLLFIFFSNLSLWLMGLFDPRLQDQENLGAK